MEAHADEVLALKNETPNSTLAEIAEHLEKLKSFLMKAAVSRPNRSWMIGKCSRLTPDPQQATSR
jgi:hypothetical protein